MQHNDVTVLEIARSDRALTVKMNHPPLNLLDAVLILELRHFVRIATHVDVLRIRRVQVGEEDDESLAGEAPDVCAAEPGDEAPRRGRDELSYGRIGCRSSRSDVTRASNRAVRPRWFSTR